MRISSDILIDHVAREVNTNIQTLVMQKYNSTNEIHLIFMLRYTTHHFVFPQSLLYEKIAVFFPFQKNIIFLTLPEVFSISKEKKNPFDLPYPNPQPPVL